MRIIQFLHGNKLGGMEKFAIDLANSLSGEHSILFIGDKVFQKYLGDHVEFEILDISKSRNNIIFLWKLVKIFKKFNPDIIQVHKQKSIQIMHRLKLFVKIPFIVTKQDMQRKKSFLNLDYAVTITEEVRSTIQAKKIFKIYNGIPYSECKKISLTNRFNIVAVGGLRKVKGYDNLIEALASIDFDFHLTIVGEGEERKNLESLIGMLNMREKVTLTGFVDNVNDYIYSADLQVISSLSEGFSLAMIEGVFYAPILLSTEVSGCTEILPNKLLMNQKEISKKIEDVYHHYSQYKEIFSKVKTQYRQLLTIERCAQEYVNVYKQICEMENV
jgi:glycosyltransferase involved in cell wall biosynthesis